jgi:hypothetical protein
MLVLRQTAKDEYGARNLRSMETGAKHGQVLRSGFSKASLKGDPELAILEGQFQTKRVQTMASQNLVL